MSKKQKKESTRGFTKQGIRDLSSLGNSPKPLSKAEREELDLLLNGGEHATEYDDPEYEAFLKQFKNDKF